MWREEVVEFVVVGGGGVEWIYVTLGSVLCPSINDQ